jgi:hypothetical protein
VSGPENLDLKFQFAQTKPLELEAYSM